ncbi:MAG: hypothetical protein PHT33_14335 [bacterium]|nr:hypothetical protein [bacterium]
MAKRHKRKNLPAGRKKKGVAARSKARAAVYRSWPLIIALIVLSAIIIWAVYSMVGNTVSFVIVPGERAGDIKADTSENDLFNIYGRSNVRRRSINVGEGELRPGVVIYPEQPLKMAEVVWRDTANRDDPGRFQVSGNRSMWRLDNEISLGTALKELERLNGRPFQLAGFGWDYGGTVLSWSGGALERLSGNGGRIILRLREPAGADITDDERMSVQGDGRFSSGNPVMQKMNPVVYSIIVEFVSK